MEEIAPQFPNRTTIAVKRRVEILRSGAQQLDRINKIAIDSHNNTFGEFELVMNDQEILDAFTLILDEDDLGSAQFNNGGATWAPPRPNPDLGVSPSHLDLGGTQVGVGPSHLDLGAAEVHSTPRVITFGTRSVSIGFPMGAKKSGFGKINDLIADLD